MSIEYVGQKDLDSQSCFQFKPFLLVSLYVLTFLFFYCFATLLEFSVHPIDFHLCTLSSWDSFFLHIWHMLFLDDRSFLSRALSRPSCFNQDSSRTCWSILALPWKAGWGKTPTGSYGSSWGTCMSSFLMAQDAVDLVKERNLSMPVETCLFRSGHNAFLCTVPCTSSEKGPLVY